MWKEFNSHRIFLYTNMATAMSCENDLLATEMEIVNHFQAAVSKWLSLFFLNAWAHLTKADKITIELDFRGLRQNTRPTKNTYGR